MSTLSHEPEKLLRDTAWLQCLARNLVGDDATAADLVQETWLAALRRDWPNGGPSRAWLRAVARNLAAMLHRSEARRQRRERESDRGEPAPSSDDLVARLEIQTKLSQAVLALDEPARTMVLLRYQEGLEPTAIARRLDLPPGTVRSRLSRALRQLRGSLGSPRGDLRLALAPLLGWRPAAARAGVGTSTTLLWSIVMKKTTLALAIAAITLLAFYWQELNDASAPRLVATPTNSPSDALLPATPNVAPNLQREPLREPRSFGSSAGWWLEGFARSAGGLGPRPAVVSIRDADRRIPGTVVGRTTAQGRIEIDVSAIFRHPRELVQALQIDITHPGHLPQRTRIDITREQRQAGFRKNRCRLPVKFELEAATASLTGRIAAPAGTPLARIEVAAVRRFAGNRPSRMIVDYGHPDEKGQFALRAARGMKLYVIAWLRGDAATQALRPSHATTTAGTPNRITLRLDAGAAIAGNLGPAALPAGVHRLLRARAEIDTPENDYYEVAHDNADGPQLPGLGEFGIAVAKPTESTIRGHRLELAWAGDAFEYQTVQGRVGPDGHFQLSGLRPGAEYDLDQLAAVAGSDTLSASRLTSRRHRAPAQDVAISGPTPALLRCRHQGQPIATPHLLHRTDKRARWSSGTTDAQGRLVIWLRRRARGIYLQIPGSKPTFVAPKPRQWTTIDFPPQVDRGALAIHLAGDAERRIERWGLHLVHAEPIDPSLDGLPIEARFGRRLTNRRVFSGLRAGRYIIEFRPDPSRGRADLESFHRPTKFTVQIQPGGVSEHTLRVDPGGYVNIPAPLELARKAGITASSVRYQVRDRHGELVTTRAVNPKNNRLPALPSERLPKSACRLYPNLAPGPYTIELFGRTGPRRKLPFTIRAFQATTLAID